MRGTRVRFRKSILLLLLSCILRLTPHKSRTRTRLSLFSTTIKQQKNSTGVQFYLVAPSLRTILGGLSIYICAWSLKPLSVNIGQDPFLTKLVSFPIQF